MATTCSPPSGVCIPSYFHNDRWYWLVQRSQSVNVIGGCAADHTISRNNAASVSVCAEQLVRRSLALCAGPINRQLSPCNVFVLLPGPARPASLVAVVARLVRRHGLWPSVTRIVSASLASHYCTVYRPRGERACTSSIVIFTRTSTSAERDFWNDHVTRGVRLIKSLSLQTAELSGLRSRPIDHLFIF